MMGIVMPETCWTYKKYNKISGIYLAFLFFSYHNDARSNKHYNECFSKLINLHYHHFGICKAGNLRIPMWDQLQWHGFHNGFH